MTRFTSAAGHPRGPWSLSNTAGQFMRADVHRSQGRDFPSKVALKIGGGDGGSWRFVHRRVLLVLPGVGGSSVGRGERPWGSDSGAAWGRGALSACLPVSLHAGRWQVPTCQSPGVRCAVGYNMVAPTPPRAAWGPEPPAGRVAGPHHRTRMALSQCRPHDHRPAGRGRKCRPGKSPEESIHVMMLGFCQITNLEIKEFLPRLQCLGFLPLTFPSWIRLRLVWIAGTSC